jgi:crotonobetainyl-CoA:carnitine CoA-transferase CaiB-like acyl-CoA transferase
VNTPSNGFAGSLAGLRVLDLTRNLAGPTCTLVLGDMGADVIKIERLEAGDDTRQWSPPAWNGQGATFLSSNRNKRSLAVNLDADEGQEILLKLAHRADVLVETFRPGSLEKRALGYDELKTANPGLIYCSISAYGQVGPLRDAAAYDPVMQANTGVMSLTGYPDAPPARLGISAIDLGAALWATIGVLSALGTRRETGHGCRIDASLYETAVWYLSQQVVGYLASGVVPARVGSATAFIAPYEAFPTADEDIFVAAPNDHLFGALVDVLGIGELASDPRFAGNQQRVLNRVELRDTIEARLRERPAAEWEGLLRARSIPCSRIRTVADLVEDPQFLALGMLADLPHPLIPDLRLVDLPISRNGRRTEHRLAPPQLGQQTTEILHELGYDDDRISRMRESGVIG